MRCDYWLKYHAYCACIYTSTPLSPTQGGSSYDTYLGLYTAISLAAGGNAISTNDDHQNNVCSNNLHSAMTVTLPAAAYIIVVEGFGNMGGAFKLNVNCSSDSGTGLAEAVASAAIIECGADVGGNTATGEPFLGNRARDVLYRFTVSAPIQVSLSTCGSEYE